MPFTGGAMIVNKHEAFLRMIFERPDDATARLIYADWLDEHDHPGGELIRVRHRLSGAGASSSERGALHSRERELVAACDQGWLESLERADWKLRYLRVRPEDENVARWAKRRQGYWSVSAQRATSRAVVAFEEEVGRPLPLSWKAFAHGCGPGQLCGDDGYDIFVPGRGRDDMVARHREWFGWATQAVTLEARWLPQDVRPWLRDSVRLGWGCNCGFLVWNTSKVTDPVRVEYEIALLDNRNLDIMEAFASFESLWNTEVEAYGLGLRGSPCFKPW